MGLGAKRGIGNTQAMKSGVCRTLARAEDPKLPLWAPTDVQLAPSSPKLVGGGFAEDPPGTACTSRMRLGGLPLLYATHKVLYHAPVLVLLQVSHV